MSSKLAAAEEEFCGSIRIQNQRNEVPLKRCGFRAAVFDLSSLTLNATKFHRVLKAILDRYCEK